MANAVMLRDKLGLPTPAGYPPAFVERYPALEGIVDGARRQGRFVRARSRRSSQRKALARPACSSRSGPIDTRPLFRPVSRGLVALLRQLPAGHWHRPTVAGGWLVRDVVAHLLDSTMRRLSFHRDGMSLRPRRGRPSATSSRSSTI